MTPDRLKEIRALAGRTVIEITNPHAMECAHMATLHYALRDLLSHVDALEDALRREVDLRRALQQMRNDVLDAIGRPA